ncbi:TonB family protein [Phyllobacterium meliloti]|uniref:TonB family protein n=1 Tax=Phyllobacterium meliloti TaxID=555317 RepID=UPI001D146CE1|nr:TonB family protein [Phyllobacterium sp. T1293]UGX88600.1 TonB family protein [Phyllobacterium sp. T1293]
MPDRPVARVAGQFQTNWREIGLWSAAAIVAIGVHAGAGWYGYSYQSDTSGGEVAAAVMIDMEPLPAPVVPEAVAELPPVEPEKVTPEPVQQEAAAPEIQPEKPVEPEPQPTPEEQVVPEEVQPEETVELPKVEVPLPVVRPEPKKPDEPKKEVPKKVVRKPVKTVVADTRSDTVVEAKQQPSISRADAQRATEKWGDKVRSHISRYVKRAKVDARGKMISVSIVVDRNGDIVSARLAVGSGSSENDQRVLDAVRNSSPTPSAPSDFAASRQPFTVPVLIQ